MERQFLDRQSQIGREKKGFVPSVPSFPIAPHPLHPSWPLSRGLDRPRSGAELLSECCSFHGHSIREELLSSCPCRLPCCPLLIENLWLESESVSSDAPRRAIQLRSDAVIVPKMKACSLSGRRGISTVVPSLR